MLQEDSQRVFNIVVHGILLWASMGFLIPAGILIMRMSSCRSDFHASRHKTVFYVHAVLQVTIVYLKKFTRKKPKIIEINKFKSEKVYM